MPFNEKQQIAIEACGDNIIVSAGAGSGKTAVLTEKVLHFIRDKNYKINEFLILTFTNLAAGEMKDRIRKALMEANLEEANYVDTADITTFDAYALSLVKKYHTKLKVSSKISIVDSSVISVKKRQIVESLFEENYRTKDTDFINMVKRFCFKNDKDLVDLVLLMHTKATLNISFDNYLDTFIDKYFSNELIDEIAQEYTNELLQIRDSFAHYISGLPHEQISKKDPRDFKNTVDEFFNAFLNSNDYDSLTKNFPLDFKVSTPRNLNEKQREMCSEFKKYYKSIKESTIEKLPIGIEAFRDYYKINIPVASTIIRLTKELEEKLQKFKNEKQYYEFNDIAKMALKLVTEEDNIRNKIKSSLKIIMIDEYQDTSDIQESFINLIQNKNVYMVGDIKQSIYRFRNAKSEIFANKYNDFRNDDVLNNKDEKSARAIDLTKNYRSRAEVLDDINYIFKQIMHQDLGGANYRKDHMIEFGNTNYTLVGNDNENKHSEYLLYNADPRFSDISELEANIIAKDIIQKINNQYKVFNKSNANPKLRNCTFSDFCILMDRGTNFDTYVRVFNEYKIPLYVENDEDISNSDVLRVVSNLIKLVKYISENEYNDSFKHSFVSIARSFLYCYSDEDLLDIEVRNSYQDNEIVIKISEIINNNKHLPIFNIIKILVFEFDIYNSLIKIGNIDRYSRHLDMLLEMFKQMGELDYSIDDFIVYLEYVNDYKLKINLPAIGNSINSVKLMNIHKSKGLEFPIIYFSGLDANYNRADYKKEYNISDKYGLIVPPLDNKENILKKKHMEHDCIIDLSEKIRLFYVDVTRAREKMLFVLNVNDTTYNKFYLPKFKQAYNFHKNYIESNNLNDNEIFEYIYTKYYNREIDHSVFRKFENEYNFRLPIDFVINEDYTLEKVKENIEIENQIELWANNYIDTVEITLPEEIIEDVDNGDDEDPDDDTKKGMSEEEKEELIKKLTIKEAYSLFQKGEIKKLHVIILSKLLGYYYKFPLLKDNDYSQIPFSETNLLHIFKITNPYPSPIVSEVIEAFIYPTELYDKYLYYRDNKQYIYDSIIDPKDTLEAETLKYVMELLQYKINPYAEAEEIANEEIKFNDIYNLFLFDKTLEKYNYFDIYKKIYNSYKNGTTSLKDFIILNHIIVNPYNDFFELVIDSNLKISEKIYCLKPFINEKYHQELERELTSDNLKCNINEIFIDFQNHLKKSAENFYALCNDFEDLNHANIIDFAYALNLDLNYLAMLNNVTESDLIDKLHKMEIEEAIKYIHDEFTIISESNHEPREFLMSYFQYEEEQLTNILNELYNKNILNKFYYLYYERFNIDFDNCSIKYEEENYPNEHVLNYHSNILINNTDYDEIISRLFNLLNVDIDENFLSLPLIERKKFNFDSIYQERGCDIYLEDDTDKNFASIIAKFLDYRKFVKNSVEMYVKAEDLNIKNSIISQKLNIEELNINHEKIDFNRASKDISLNSNKKSIEFGNKIHFLMEVTDFNNPNYSNINEYYKNIIIDFLNWDVMKNISKGVTYKEYEFYDEKANLNGIIDLMVVYDNYIDIIDYKTKNIIDDQYEKQLLTYKKYIEYTFNKKTNCYLYSLLDRTSKKVI